MQVLCIGAAHWDLIGRASGAVAMGDDLPGRIERRPGGVAANVAIGLAQRGVTVGLAASVGADDDGERLLSRLADAGIDCSLVSRDTLRTGLYLAIEGADGELVAAIADTLPCNVPGDLSCPVIFADGNLPATALSDVAAQARDSGAWLVLNPVSPTRATQIERHTFVGAAVVANLAEATVLTGTVPDGAADAARGLLERGALAALVTDGARDAAFATLSGIAAGPPRRLQQGSVTGAGDALIAGWIAHCLGNPNWSQHPGPALRAALSAAAGHMDIAQTEARP